MLDALSGKTRLFPIIGDPIAAVQSPAQLTRGFERRSHNAACVPMQVPLDKLDVVLAGLSATPNIDGLLVTMPHKAALFERCGTSSERAKRLGAVSVARRNEDGSWHGDMLDGLAFVKAQTDAGAKPRGAKVLLIGAGSAGGAIALALLEAGARELVIHDTNEEHANRLVLLLRKHDAGAAVKTGPADPSGCNMVCNASPAGMKEGDFSPVPAASFRASMFVGDVVAGHGVTPFLAAANKAGCSTANGVQMVEAVQEMMLDFMLGH
jgi:shikimate dehydrogenase